MDDIYVYIVRLPYGIREMVTPCFEGYTVYISESLTMQQRRNAYNHALKHIRNGDFERHDVQKIETEAHK